MRQSGKLLAVVGVTVVALFSAGCTTNPFTGESKASKAG